MTINKAQGQTLKAVGVDLSKASFSHGQEQTLKAVGVDLSEASFFHCMFYVAASRTGTPDHLWVYAPQKQTKYFVYHEVL
jgi:hypothetical protein